MLQSVFYHNHQLEPIQDFVISRSPVGRMKNYHPGSNLYIKSYPRRSFTNSLSSKSIDSTAMNVALNSGKSSLAFHKIRGFGKAQLWGRLTEKTRRIFLGEGTHLTREMLGSSVLQAHIKKRNEELKSESKELCVTHKTAYRPG